MPFIKNNTFEESIAEYMVYTLMGTAVVNVAISVRFCIEERCKKMKKRRKTEIYVE